MNDQRMVDVGLLWRAVGHLASDSPWQERHQLQRELKAIISGPGVEPVATKLETQQFDCFHVSAKDAAKLRALPVGTKIYLAAPSAPVQAVPDGSEATDALKALDSRLRECFGLPITAEEAYDSFYQEMVADALNPQPPKESTAQSVACPTDKEK